MQLNSTRSCRLDIDSLAKSYAGTRAVDNVSLSVLPGEVMTLLGPSGCGKTTLLQSIAGFVTPDTGDIRLDGESILPIAPERRRTAMLFQQYALFPHLSVRDNVGFGLRMARVNGADAARRVDEALRLVRIEALGERRPAQLSGGQRQRVALARAVVTEPRLLLLDEPLGALDQNLREEMQLELRKLQRKLGLTTLMVTHDQHEAIVLSDRIAVLNEGRIEQIGTPTDIYDHPRTRYIATFTGVENLLSARLDRNGLVTIGDLLIPGVRTDSVAPGEVALAIRSEAVEVQPKSQAPDEGKMAGTVAFTQILGASVRYEIVLDSGSIVMSTAVRRDTAPLDVGQRVSVALAASRCTVLAS